MIALTLLAFVVISLILLAVGFSTLRTLFKNFSPRDARVQEDINAMRKEIEPFVEQLIPLNREELRLFSLNQVNQTLKKNITTTGKGVFTSIYQEPLMAYAYKKYVGNDDALVYVRTTAHEMIYRIKKKEVKVVINKMYFGTIKDGKLFTNSKKQPVAQLSPGNNPLALPVLVGNREVGAISTEQTNKNIQERAFKYINQDIQGEEEKAFLSLAMLELVQKAVNQ